MSAENKTQQNSAKEEKQQDDLLDTLITYDDEDKEIKQGQNNDDKNNQNEQQQEPKQQDFEVEYNEDAQSQSGNQNNDNEDNKDSEEKVQNNNKQGNEGGKNSHRNRSRSRDKENEKKVEPCCQKCKENERMNGKTCVCVVPASQRRKDISKDGCQNCGCKGCSYEDVYGKKQQKEQLKNGCCKGCLKAYSENGKSCMCNVPHRDRKLQLPKSGCKKCGCHGCHPLDVRLKEKNSSSHRKGRYSRSRSRSPDDLRNLNNLQNSSVGNLITQQLNVFPPLLGFGIPQRTYSYLTGKPDKKRY